MDVSIAGLRWFVAIAGPLVLVSYVVGIMRAEDPMALWGGVEDNVRKATIPFMFIAAAGFLGAAYILLWYWNPTTLASLHWPGGEPDGRGTQRVLLAYALYLIPSMLWVETTLLHMRVGTGVTQTIAIAVLTLVSIGLVMLGSLAYGAIQEGVPKAWWLMVAVIAMMVQSTVNDNIIWVWKFPW